MVAALKGYSSIPTATLLQVFSSEFIICTSHQELNGKKILWEFFLVQIKKYQKTIQKQKVGSRRIELRLLEMNMGPYGRFLYCMIDWFVISSPCCGFWLWQFVGEQIRSAWTSPGFLPSLVSSMVMSIPLFWIHETRGLLIQPVDFCGIERHSHDQQTQWLRDCNCAEEETSTCEKDSD